MADGNQQQQVQQAKLSVKQFIEASKIKPQTIIQLGDMAEAALKDKALYQVFREQAMKSGAADEEDVPAKPNPHLLVSFVALGKLASQMMQSGELAGA